VALVQLLVPLSLHNNGYKCHNLCNSYALFSKLKFNSFRSLLPSSYIYIKSQVRLYIKCTCCCPYLKIFLEKFFLTAQCHPFSFVVVYQHSLTERNCTSAAPYVKGCVLRLHSAHDSKSCMLTECGNFLLQQMGLLLNC
jgi:hypothetical protein